MQKASQYMLLEYWQKYLNTRIGQHNLKCLNCKQMYPTGLFLKLLIMQLTTKGASSTETRVGHIGILRIFGTRCILNRPGYDILEYLAPPRILLLSIHSELIEFGGQ